MIRLRQIRLKPGARDEHPFSLPTLRALECIEVTASPVNQLGLLRLIADAVVAGSQFVIATHSPILMAFPGAVILDFDTPPPAPVAWEDLETVQLTRAFLNHPDRYLRFLDDPP